MTNSWIKPQIEDDGIIGGFSGWLSANGKSFRVPAKVVREQESFNTEGYYTRCSYDSKEELRMAAKQYARRLVKKGVICLGVAA